jgi:iron complex outermembrane receptor protein
MTVDAITIEMKAEHEEEEEIVIQSTRSSRTISDIPTRVEFVAGEELDEKANMKPGDIRMVLNESTGITTQQTSAYQRMLLFAYRDWMENIPRY